MIQISQSESFLVSGYGFWEKARKNFSFPHMIFICKDDFGLELPRGHIHCQMD